ncbi:hypothetical protein RHGRI_038823 [Rhododendron griersonianum]|uniref:Uncharacterized protein n=1 Tax=Rhododendron griersonianum TaxID=479676 RepID=A0AAV6HI55_9ERIC|nr:hypothetical protein RHGRI_038823 [Rhododendron griersonianum]
MQERGAVSYDGMQTIMAQKMKELEMMDVNDVDHVLDIEEVLHLYSRLKSPVYPDIVNKFDLHGHVL